ncbi:endonuclease/exonuclease/phosphatase family protein [Sulfitobacter sp. HNIBRBA3233]|uniref:endonuclease/exonuclease/phosphatase family protein n=1 Tax=Sulfitobacter marinivivus TaxID=3158558 RepID=UPI0032DF9D4F
MATYNSELGRDGPGLLLRDILRGSDPQIDATIAMLIAVEADIIALQGFDHDLRNTALSAFADLLAAQGVRYDHLFALPSNAGRDSGLDLNGNGRLGDPDDAHGYGRFHGAGAMAILSRYPVDRETVEDFTSMLWRDLPGNIYPQQDGRAFGGTEVFHAHRLSSKGHWIVPIETPQGKVSVWTFHASPPVFDGPEDRNGRRNHDETAFWLWRLQTDQTASFVLLGTANVDPDRGDGRPEAIEKLLSHPRLQNPFPETPTADFTDPVPGDLRVDYLLPAAGWRVLDHGTATDPAASRHSLLWVDIEATSP